MVAQVVIRRANVIHVRLAAVLERFNEIGLSGPWPRWAQDLGSLRLVAAVRHSLQNQLILCLSTSALFAGSAGDVMSCSPSRAHHKPSQKQRAEKTFLRSFFLQPFTSSWDGATDAKPERRMQKTYCALASEALLRLAQLILLTP